MATSLPIESLRKIDLFEGLTDEELIEVSKLCSEHCHESGELCVAEGDRVNCAHFVKRGKVVIEIQSPKSAEDKTVIDTLEDGDLFAWSALVTSTLTASVRAVEPTEILDVNAVDLLALCEKRPRMGYIIMKNLTLIINSRLTKSRGKLSAAYGELKEKQEQLVQAEKLSSLGQMAGSIAHEINNPLGGVLTYTKLLNKKISDGSISKETALSYLSTIESELTRVSRLVKNLQDFGRQSPPCFREFDPNDIINRALEIAEHSAELQNIQIIKKLAPLLPKLVADFDQLTQVCTNLILNAIQAMPQGGELTLRTSAHGSQVEIEVRDTGCGVPPENMSKLFTPFFTTKREVKGVGLGLAISYGIVQRHGGSIEVQSKVRKGTTFTVYLPLQHEKS
jgi:signal transduction histidine kinase